MNLDQTLEFEDLEKPQTISDIDSTAQKRKGGRPQKNDLNAYKDLIVKLFSEENINTVDIARKLNLEFGLDISGRSISRYLNAWGFRRPAQELSNRVHDLYNKNLSDDQIAEVLIGEGFRIKPNYIRRIRQKLGLRRRSRYSEFREHPEGDDAEKTKTSTSRSRYSEFREHPEKDNAEQTKTSTSKSPKKRTIMAHNVGLIPQVTKFVENYMSAYDGSHDFNHIRRVVGLAHKIYREVKEADGLELDLEVVTLAALLHDVGDKKYLKPGQDGKTLVLATLLGFGAEDKLAVKVQRIVLGVSYSSEIKDPTLVKDMIEMYPELAVVQDADRLDAIGAIGIGRTFTFGGAKGAKEMGETIQHFEDKLEKLESMMKTTPGKRMARERTERLKTFKQWWGEELKEAEGLLRPK